MYNQSYTSPSFVALHLPVSKMPKGIVLRELHVCVFTIMFTVVCPLKSMRIPSFIVVSVSYMPIVMYGLRLFILQEHNLTCLFCSHYG